MRKIIRAYNKMAAVLLEYELLYHRGWVQAVEMGQHGLSATLLIRHPQTKVLLRQVHSTLLHEPWSA